ncbi:hypothetical protein AMECASPLE_025501, partial [Ameca splendens]
RENRFTRLIETASLLGTSLGQFASAGLREKQRDISVLFLFGQSLSGVPGGRDRTIGKEVLLYRQWHHGNSAVTVCLAVPEVTSRSKLLIQSAYAENPDSFSAGELHGLSSQLASFGFQVSSRYL